MKTVFAHEGVDDGHIDGPVVVTINHVTPLSMLGVVVALVIVVYFLLKK